MATLDDPGSLAAAAAAVGGVIGFLSAHAAADDPTFSTLTREPPGWKPVQPSLLQDLAVGH